MKRSRVYLRLCLPTVLVLTAIGCSGKNKDLPKSASEVVGMYQEIENSAMHFYDGGRKVWQLEARYMRKSLGDTGEILAVPVELSLFDSLGSVSTTVLADTGTTNMEKDTFTVWGNVYVKTRDELVVKAERLRWSRETHRVKSDRYVQIETPRGDVLRGKGLDANESFTRWSLLSSVSGEFPDFQKRMEGREGVPE